jgi:hypothetical protein
MSSLSIPADVQLFLAANGLSADTRLYREAVFTHLVPTGTADQFRLAANATPSESVIDVYGAGHLVQAESLGRGLAFAESSNPNWQETMEMRAMKGVTGAMPEARVEVEVRLGDVLAQGGRVYPVESVTVEKAWYCTLPTGGVNVTIVM